ncbi:hypothetical protein AUJ65_01790 [Candidatus Micrarchaeota archaeon CG1_02_51_15]|nr:MAG: hypothetical protein AUJ65_01790 [Candidatus Micrarchaeota archaeon CG1_02_51_15]
MLALPKNKARDFLLELKRAEPNRQVLAPIADGRETRYFIFPSTFPLFTESLPSYSAKKFFLPPREDLFRFRAAKGKYEATEENLECDRVLFGLRHCDVHGLKVLDKFFNDDSSDNYWRRREGTAIIALNCPQPAASCFCDAMGTRHSKGADVELEDAGKEWLLEAKTRVGKKLAAQTSETLVESNAKPLQEEPCAINASKHKLLALKENEGFWDAIASGCLNCGACNIVCPTCTCFDVEDDCTLEGEGSRCRHWTSCVLNDYTRTAGDHVFRKGNREKALIRVQHKLGWFKEKFGEASCTGCGRCSLHCPTKVSTADVALKWLK